MLLPGGVLPAELAYGSLIAALGDDAEAITKDLELYAGDTPPDDYTLDHEIAGVLRETGARGWDSFHLVGYSAGGAAALAFTARHPDNVLSLALLEPAWAGNWDLSPAEERVWEEYERLMESSAEQFMEGFVRLELREGVEPPAPPAGDPPPWMATRPPGLKALMRSFQTYDLTRESLEQFSGPVYFALGALSNPDQYGELARRLGGVFRDFQLEVFDERHHFDPPHRVEPERLADSLKALWQRAARE
jgi:pimeloyl-ACP methyl ester carboxylesterase